MRARESRSCSIGACAYGVFKEGSQHHGQYVGIAGEHLTGAEMAAAFTRAVGKDVGYNAVEPEVYRGFGFPGAEDLGNMFQYKRDFNDEFCRPRDVAASRRLHAGLQSFDDWLAANKDGIALG